MKNSIKITRDTTPEEIVNLSPYCRCEACEHGCKVGSGIMLEQDITKTAEFLKISEEELKKKYLEEIEKFNRKRYRPKSKKDNGKEYGPCIFYSEKNGCKINNTKPFECRIASGCNGLGEEIIAWFNLNYFVNENDPESVRQYNDYIQNKGKVIKGGELKKILPGKKKREDILNFKILK